MIQHALSPGISGEWMSEQGFSDVVITDTHIHVAGQVGQAEDGTTPDAFEEQARLAFRNVRRRILEAGGDPANVVAMTILMDESLKHDRRHANDVIKEAKAAELPEPRPATTGFFVSGLAFRWFVVEVQAVAVR